MESANQIHVQPLAIGALVKRKHLSTKPTPLTTGVVCHPDTEQNRPYKIPWPCRELNWGPTASQARALLVCHTTVLFKEYENTIKSLLLRPSLSWHWFWLTDKFDPSSARNTFLKYESEEKCFGPDLKTQEYPLKIKI